jgi:hypothetical protein
MADLAVPKKYKSLREHALDILANPQRQKAPEFPEKMGPSGGFTANHERAYSGPDPEEAIERTYRDEKMR